MDVWGVQDFNGGGNCRCGGNSKRTTIRSGDRICDWSAASLGKPSMDEELLLMLEKRKWFFNIKSTPGEDAIKIIEMTNKGFRIVHKP